MRPRGKTIALSTATVGVMVLVAVAFVSRDWVVQQYYIHRLQSTDDETRLRAVEALASARSVLAVPHLMRLLEKEKREMVLHWETGETTNVSLEYGTAMTPVAYALYRIGKGALPRIFEEEQICSTRTHRVAALTRID